MAKLPRIPDLLTTANLCCGVGSIMLASQGELVMACWLVFIGAGFDVLDGLAARALGGGSELGKQLDSLADMVTFGVAPGMLIFFSTLWFGVETRYSSFWLRSLPVFILIVGSCWRLARFNTDAGDDSDFKGLATPANALFWASLPVGITSPYDDLVMTVGWSNMVERSSHQVLTMPWLTIVVSAVLSLFMLSSIPLPSLKFKHFQWKGNQVIFILIGIGAVLVVLYGILAVPLILLLYLLSPLWGKLFPKEPVTTHGSKGSP